MAGRCCPAGAPRAAPDSLSEARSAGTVVTNEHAGAAHPQGFARSQRLLSSADFARVFRAGRRRSDRWFTVIAAPADGANARLGLAVSRKVSRSAVQRNRIKRVVRESFRKLGAQMPVLDIVVIARPGAAACDNTELSSGIDALLQRTANSCDASRST